MKAIHPSNETYLLSQILRFSRVAAANSDAAAKSSAAAAKSSNKAVAQTRARLGWIHSMLAALVLVVFVFPMARYFEVPHVGSGLDSFISWSQQTGRSAGILIAEKITYRQTEITWTNGIHPDLMSVYTLANEFAHQAGIHIDIREGLRTVKRQAKLFKAGYSSTMNSRHLDGHALDLVYQYQGKRSNTRDWYWARKIDVHMQKAAKQLGIRVEWGGRWKSFPDGFHWQLPWKTHKKTGKKPVKKQVVVKAKQKEPALTSANFERLLNDIIISESSGDHTEENQFGMLGLCQANAATLVEIGLVSRAAFDKLDKDSKAGRGQQIQFLSNPNNWLLKGGKAKYMSSPSIQMKACREIMKLHLHYGKSAGVLNGDSSQRRIAGYLKAAQFGHVNATAYYLRGEDNPDGNQVLTSTYALEGEATVKE